MQVSKDITLEDLEYIIEKKLLELLGDPDYNLELSDEFRAKLEERLKNPQKKYPHEEVMKRFA